MPEPVTADSLFTLDDAGEIAPASTGLHGAAIGFCGKLPARGDFVGSGLPRAFVEPWHDWLQSVLATGRQMLGEEWVAAWLEAPIWRFALSPGICGPDAVLGLWMPSVDRVGRYFPLTFAAVMAGAEAAALIREGGGFLAAAESAGLDALARDLAPELVAARLAAAASAGRGDPGKVSIDPELCPPGGALWWSAGSPRVPVTAFATGALPDEAIFAGMVDAGRLLSPAQGQEDLARDRREP
jgi:type VI secretion system protein ImpM